MQNQIDTIDFRRNQQLLRLAAKASSFVGQGKLILNSPLRRCLRSFFLGRLARDLFAQSRYAVGYAGSLIDFHHNQQPLRRFLWSFYLSFLLFFPLLSLHSSWTQESLTQPSLVLIESFPVKVLRSSRSKRIFLFEDEKGFQPRPGKLLLLRNQGTSTQPVVALRVLKNYDSIDAQKNFAAKVIKKYGDLDSQITYLALQKIGEQKISVPIKDKSRQQLMDAAQWAHAIEPKDEDLDRDIAPPAMKDSEQKIEPKLTPHLEPHESELTPTEDRLDIVDLKEVEEDSSPLDQEDDINTNIKTTRGEAHAFGAHVSLYSFKDAEAKMTRYTGAGFRYAYNLYPTKRLQGWLETSLGYIRIFGYAAADDRITLFPFSITARPTLPLSSSMSVFVYAGYRYTFLSDSGASFHNLKSNGLTGGIGALGRIGPGWSLRADLGLDQFSFGGQLSF